MTYDKKASWGDNQWHCPFPPEWVERMKRAVKVCKDLPDVYVEAAMNRDSARYRVPPGDFLSEPQDARGLPLSWCQEYEQRHRHWPNCCVAIYDYDTVPDMVVTDGEEDWAYNTHGKVLQA